jgi:hypothetical protein
VSWMPNPTVTIAGQDYTGRTVDSVSLRRGRDTVYASPQAGYATVALINTGGMVEPVVGDLVTVTLDDSSSVAQPLFSGFVSDWQSDVVSLGGSVLVRYSVQVVGPVGTVESSDSVGWGSACGVGWCSGAGGVGCWVADALGRVLDVDDVGRCCCGCDVGDGGPRFRPCVD